MPSSTDRVALTTDGLCFKSMVDCAFQNRERCILSKQPLFKRLSIAGKLGHCPQEDFADAFAPVLADFFAGEDISVKGTKKFRKFETEDKSYVAAGTQSGNMIDV
jgi:hypothetical protein